MKCAYFDAESCRSCSELARPYAQQLARKQAHAQDALAAFAPIEWLPPLASAEQGFRNKAKMAVGGGIDAPTLGLLSPDGAGIDLMQCALYPESMRIAFEPIRQALIAARVPPYDLNTRRGEAKYVLLTEAPGTAELLLRFVLRSREAVERISKQVPALQSALPLLRVVSVNLLPEHKAVTEGEQEIVLTASSRIRCRLNDVDFALTPRAFLQTHSSGAAALYRQAREWIDAQSPASVWDLYCGVGGFALHAAAPKRQVVGVESTLEAIDAARASNPAVDWVCADASDWACAQPRVADCVIVNPPRRGIGSRLASWLDQSQAPRLVYSSCNIESLARDLAALPHYRVLSARLFDLFPHTTHFETIVLLARHR
ncbi:MAG TPA: methyltransferase domain-containing protein [Xanthomonadales bacterium]|nr:methyltransferase domain-containing protein [Xanthomonadales bacterium]